MNTDSTNQEGRFITVVATKGGRIEKFLTTAKTWGEFKREIQDKYDLNNLKATENINKTTLEHIDSVLPYEDFRIFLRPEKTKSGAIDFSEMSYSEMRNTYIKPSEEVKTFLNSYGSKTNRNWTQLKTPEMREQLALFYSKNSISEKTDITIDSGEKIILTPLGKVKLAKTLLEEAYLEFEDDDDIEEEDKEEVFSLFDDELFCDYSSIDTVIGKLEDFYQEDGEEIVKEKVAHIETEEEKKAREEKELLAEKKRKEEEASKKEIEDAMKEWEELEEGL